MTGEQEFSGIEVADNESVCLSCHLVHLTAAGTSGVCPDCIAEGVLVLPV